MDRLTSIPIAAQPVWQSSVWSSCSGWRGGNALIGRQLYPLMVEADLEAIHVSPRMVYVDSSRPDLVDGFTRKTFTAMIDGVRESAIEAGIIDRDAFDAGVRDLNRTTESDGVFCYTFFKGVGEKRKS